MSESEAAAAGWNWTDDGAEVTIQNDYTGPGGNVVIPDYIGGLPVTKISDKVGPAGVFYYVANTLTSISGGKIETIGSEAFRGCTALETASFPNATTINDSAFLACHSLTSTSLENVNSIAGGAFYNCSSLASISLPNLLTIAGGVFYNCSSLLSIYYGATVPTHDALNNQYSGTPLELLIYYPEGAVYPALLPTTGTNQRSTEELIPVSSSSSSLSTPSSSSSSTENTEYSWSSSNSSSSVSSSSMSSSSTLIKTSSSVSSTGRFRVTYEIHYVPLYVLNSQESDALGPITT